MSIQTPAFKLICPSCGWSKLLAPMGVPGQVPDKCPACGSEQLSRVKPNIAEEMLISIKYKI